MKCNEKTCNEEAVKKIVRLGSEEVFYCLKHCIKYQQIMQAMGTPLAKVYEIE